MTTATVARPGAAVPAARPARRGTFAGTGTLVRFMLRRDRVRLPGWVAGIGLFWLYYTRLVPSVYASDDDLRGISQLMEGPMGRVLTGPAHGFADLSHDRLVVGGYGLYVVLLAALMSLLTVVRHTRAEEQTGRAELVRANVVGRHAPLSAALLVTVVTNLAVAATVAAVTVTAPEFGPGGSLLFAAGVALAGLAFAGLASVTVQVTEFSRAAAGLAGGALGAAFVVRALGDMTREGGSVVSWLSPLAWSQQTAPFVLDRWWPLLLSAGLAAATTAVGYVLSERRDVGATMFAVRPGPDRAASWLRSPFTLSLRLQRASIVGWTASLAVAGLVYGAWADAMLTSLDDLPDVLVDVTGGEGDIVVGYLALMALFMALTIGIYVVLAMQSLRTEETSGRGEPVLATATSRWAWLGTHVAAVALGVGVTLAVTGLATGIGAAAVTGEVAHVWEVTGAHLAYAPAVLCVLGLGALLFGVAPRMMGLAWAVLGYGLVVGVFGPVMELPGWAHDLSPFEHVGRIPQQPLRVVPLVVLAVIAAAGVLAGLVTFGRRDVNV